MTGADARDRLRDLYRRKREELAQEALGPAEHQQALDELQLGFLQELDAAGPAPALLSVALPVAALALYLHAGDPRAVAELAMASAATHEGSGNQVETAVARLTERLRANPDDLEGWLVLARSQETMERFGDAAQSYRQAIAVATRQQAPADIVARLQADLADTLGSAHDGDLGGPAQAAIDAALALDANQPKALALAGAAALRGGDIDAARRHWQRLLGPLPPGSDMALCVESDLQRLSAPAAATSITARVGIDAALAGRIPAQATVFVVVRPAGERMPAAVVRLRAGDLPADVVIDDRHAISPDRPLSRFSAVTVQVRISPSGQALAQPGEWFSDALPARPGQQGLALTVKAGRKPGA